MIPVTVRRLSSRQIRRLSPARSLSGASGPRRGGGLTLLLTEFALVTGFGVGLVGAILGGGYTYETFKEQSDERNGPLKGDLITLKDGRRVHTLVEGKGPVTVVFEADHGALLYDFHDVIEELQPFAKCVAYTRPGLGLSTNHHTPTLEHVLRSMVSAPKPLNAKASGDIARDLSQVLDALQVEGPVIVVGSGMGGMYASQFAREMTGDERWKVSGLVLLDPMTEGIVKKHNEISPVVNDRVSVWIKQNTSVSALASIGIVRMLMSFNAHTTRRTKALYGDDVANDVISQTSRAAHRWTMVDELFGRDESERLASKAKAAEESIPTIVVSHGINTGEFFKDVEAAGVSRDLTKQMDDVWQASLKELTQHYQPSIFVQITDALQNITQTHPDVVASLVRLLADGLTERKETELREKLESGGVKLVHVNKFCEEEPETAASTPKQKAGSLFGFFSR